MLAGTIAAAIAASLTSQDHSAAQANQHRDLYTLRCLRLSGLHCFRCPPARMQHVWCSELDSAARCGCAPAKAQRRRPPSFAAAAAGWFVGVSSPSAACRPCRWLYRFGGRAWLYAAARGWHIYLEEWNAAGAGAGLASWVRQGPATQCISIATCAYSRPQPNCLHQRRIRYCACPCTRYPGSKAF